MSPTDTIPPPRQDAVALIEPPRPLATVLNMTDVSVAHAPDEHLGFDRAVDLVLTTASPHAEAPRTPLTPTESTKAETTR